MEKHLLPAYSRRWITYSDGSGLEIESRSSEVLVSEINTCGNRKPGKGLLLSVEAAEDLIDGLRRAVLDARHIQDRLEEFNAQE